MVDTPEYWHVVVEAKSAPIGSEIAVVDQTREWIESRILEPRRRGHPITIQGRELPWTDIEYFARVTFCAMQVFCG